MAYIKKKKKEVDSAHKRYIESLIFKCEAKRLPLRMVREFVRLTKANKCRELPDKLDPAIISMEIKDDKNQTLESLAVRIGTMYIWKYEDILQYLQDHIDVLYYNESQPATMHIYKKIKWIPGNNNDAHELFTALLK